MFRLCWILILFQFVTTTVVASLQDWVLPDSRIGVRTAPLLLLTRPDVQFELRMSAEQTKAIQRIVNDLWSRAASLRGKSGHEALAGRRAIDEDQQKQLDALLDQDQRSRLIQLVLQWEGPLCLLSRSWVTSWVGISTEERQGMANLVNARLTTANKESGSSQVAARAMVGEGLLNSLSSDQRSRWNQLTGTPFHFGKTDNQVAKTGSSLIKP